jgi:hypothetical protein
MAASRQNATLRPRDGEAGRTASCTLRRQGVDGARISGGTNKRLVTGRCRGLNSGGGYMSTRRAPARLFHASGDSPGLSRFRGSRLALGSRSFSSITAAARRRSRGRPDEGARLGLRRRAARLFVGASRTASVVSNRPRGRGWRQEWRATAGRVGVGRDAARPSRGRTASRHQRRSRLRSRLRTVFENSDSYAGRRRRGFAERCVLGRGIGHAKVRHQHEPSSTGRRRRPRATAGRRATATGFPRHRWESSRRGGGPRLPASDRAETASRKWPTSNIAKSIRLWEKNIRATSPADQRAGGVGQRRLAAR